MKEEENRRIAETNNLDFYKETMNYVAKHVAVASLMTLISPESHRKNNDK